MNPRFPIHKLSLAALMILLAVACPAAARQGDEPTAPVVHNGATPTEGLQVIRLEEMWRAGGDDEDVLFGQIFRAEADENGNVYLLDTQLSEVPVFSPDGEHIKTLSREGEGPGESMGPVDLTMMPDGALGIMQRFPGSIVKIDREGIPLGNLPIGATSEGGFNSLFTGRCKGVHLMLVGQHASMGEGTQTRTWFVSSYDVEGNELVRFFALGSEIDFSRPVIRELDVIHPVMFASTPGPDGSVYIAPHLDRYAINVYAPEGDLVRVIERDFEIRKRNDLETGRVQAVFDFWASRSPTEVETDVNDVAATITNLYVDDGNNLWVENSRSGTDGPEGTLLAFDVFDAEGRYLKQVALIGEGQPQNDRLFWVRDDMVVLVKGAIPAMYAAMADGAADNEEEAGLNEMEVVCFRVPH